MPTLPDFLFQQAIAAHAAGRLAEAEQLCRQIFTAHSYASHLLARIAKETGHSEAAIDLFQVAAQQNPGDPAMQQDAAAALMFSNQSDNVPKAAQYLRNYLRLKPQSSTALINLGEVLKRIGQVNEAFSLLQTAVRLHPELPDAHYNLATLLWEQGESAAAAAEFRAAIAIKDDDPRYFNNLGLTLAFNGDPDGAIAAYQAALRLNPKHLSAYNNLANAFKDQGRFDEAITAYRTAMSITPSATAHSNLIHAMHYTTTDSAAIDAELTEWRQQFAEPRAVHIAPHENSPDPDRPLRIGYLSPDFRAHVVGWNLLPLLSAHDHKNFQIYCYNTALHRDSMTPRLQRLADVWRDIQTLDDVEAERAIRRDRIDILVDLSLHSSNNRLLLFARKPAPVQVTYLGYCGSTGLKTVDWRFSDPHLDPPELDEAHYSERTYRLPHTYWCYTPGGETPEPAAESETFTFASLNNFCKASPAALDLWKQILDRVSHAKLLLNTPLGSHRQALLDRFGDRIEMLPMRGWENYIATYQRIDVALDPFPYNGGITTCDALYMGVPVVTLSGPMPMGRAGRSLLNCVGLPELVASSPDDYIRIAVELANDPDRRAHLRSTLRDRMRNSPLMDAPNFARDIEAAYRRMWGDWCATRS